MLYIISFQKCLWFNNLINEFQAEKEENPQKLEESKSFLEVKDKAILADNGTKDDV